MLEPASAFRHLWHAHSTTVVDYFVRHVKRGSAPAAAAAAVEEDVQVVQDKAVTDLAVEMDVVSDDEGEDEVDQEVSSTLLFQPLFLFNICYCF